MQISEAKLSRIIREEIALRIVKQTISEVVSEMELDLTEEQTLLFEETVLDKIKKAAKKYALPIWAVAALGFGSEIADRESMEAEATAMAASKIKKAIKIGGEYEQARLDALKDAIKTAGKEGKVPPDLLADLGLQQSSDDAKDIRVNILDREFVRKGKFLVNPGNKHAQSFEGGQATALPLIYVPYEVLPDGYRDTFTGGATKEDLFNFYKRMDVQSLGKMVDDMKQWGSEGQGQFVTVQTPDGPAKLLTSSYSIALDALMQKNADRGTKGKDTYKPELYQ
mgnify:CR=1 FL=1|tara:strand:- start:584 stop:1429 length:846 start_codon:yes stop_codon:yes gene_type:complete